MVKNAPFNAGDTGLIPGWGTKILHAAGQLSPHTTAIELTCLNDRARVPQTIESTCSGAYTPQLERENLHTTTREKHARHNEETVRCNKRFPHASTEIPCATTKTRHSQKIKKINKLNK